MPSASSSGDTWKERIIIALRKQPMDTGELLRVLKPSTAGSVYDALSLLRKAGLVETKLDEASGMRKNFVREQSL